MMLARCTATVFDAELELRGDLAVRMAVADQLQHFELARRQAVVAFAFQRRRPRHPGSSTVSPGGDPLHRRRQVEIERVLQNVAARAGVHRLAHQRLLGVHAEHQDRDAGACARIAASRPGRSCPASRSPSR